MITSEALAARALASGLPAVLDVITEAEARPPLDQYRSRRGQSA
jgi:hypothetical protein